MSIQRRRGQRAIVYPSKVVESRRGAPVSVPDMDNGIPIRAAFIPQRSARAEVPGQLGIKVTRMIFSHEIENFDLWSRVYWRGRYWDVVTPPSYHHGATRHVRHYSADLRERPKGGDSDG